MLAAAAHVSCPRLDAGAGPPVGAGSAPAAGNRLRPQGGKVSTPQLVRRVSYSVLAVQGSLTKAPAFGHSAGRRTAVADVQSQDVISISIYLSVGDIEV